MHTYKNLAHKPMFTCDVQVAFSHRFLTCSTLCTATIVFFGTERCNLSFYNYLRHNDGDVTKPVAINTTVRKVV